MVSILTSSLAALMMAGTLAGTQAASSAAEDFQCGQASNGLSVTISSAMERSAACATALDVAKPYLANFPSGEYDSVDVTVGGKVWNCQQFQTAEEVNPHGQCDTDSGEEVRLYS